MTNRTDNFNRADTTSNIGSPSDGGSAWNQISGQWGILNNVGYWFSGSTWSVCVLESSVSSVEVQATLTVLADGNAGGLSARVADNNNYILLDITPGASGTVQLYRYVAGTFTLLATYTGLVAVGSVYKLRLDSSNLITGYQDGIARVSATDGAGASNTLHGLAGGVGQSYWDDFSITEIVPVGDSTFLLGQGCM